MGRSRARFLRGTVKISGPSHRTQRPPISRPGKRFSECSFPEEIRDQLPGTYENTIQSGPEPPFRELAGASCAAISATLWGGSTRAHSII
jgi:hypothetical protein